MTGPATLPAGRELDAEAARFVEILAGLTKHIPQPVQATGRPRLPMADMVFICTYMVYMNLSSRRFISKLRALYETGVVSSLCHFNSIWNYMGDPMVTPVLEDLVHTTGGMIGRYKTDADSDTAWSEFENRVESTRWLSKTEAASENEVLCVVLCQTIRELCGQRPLPAVSAKS